MLARQENLETIHRHSVVAERSGLLAEILAELETGEHSRHHTHHARVARGALRLTPLAAGDRLGRGVGERCSCSSIRLRRPKK